MGIFNVCRLITGKYIDRANYHYKILFFKWLIENKYAKKVLDIIITALEIFAGLAFITGKIKW